MYFRAVSDDSNTTVTVETSVNTWKINNLKPNKQYVIYITTIVKKGESLPSETVIAWTDPIVPAYAEVKQLIILITILVKLSF